MPDIIEHESQMMPVGMKINQLLTHEVGANLPSQECAVLLSGGVDSISVAFIDLRVLYYFNSSFTT